jgi:peptidoglycan hydrolase-like protein with peptidoglycan-binding domain
MTPDSHLTHAIANDTTSSSASNSSAASLSAGSPCDLYPWSCGPIVVELQELLNAHGFTLRIDGDFGGITEAAVRIFQKRQGLRSDGVVNTPTWNALKRSVPVGSRMLKRGHSGADVYQLQGLLQIHGYHLRRDGFFGAETQGAVLGFQQRHKLLDDGIVDCKTWTMLTGRPLPTPPKQNRWFINPRKWW